MIGDKLIVKEHHRKISKKIFGAIRGEVGNTIESGNKYIISVAGESGSGKSETAVVLKDLFTDHGINAHVLAQDDYFVFPPVTNHSMRIKNPAQVGLYEVKLDYLDANIWYFKNKIGKLFTPVINYREDRIYHELVSVDKIDLIIVEGTYTSTLRFPDKKIFIDRSYIETKKDRRERGREKMDPFIESILKIEHRIIQGHKKYADIIIKADYSDIIIRDRR